MKNPDFFLEIGIFSLSRARKLHLCIYTSFTQGNLAFACAKISLVRVLEEKDAEAPAHSSVIQEQLLVGALQ